MEDEIKKQSVAFPERAAIRGDSLAVRAEQPRDWHHGVFSASGAEVSVEAAYSLQPVFEWRAIGYCAWDYLNKRYGVIGVSKPSFPMRRGCG